jgi:hypothetical protein
VGRLSAERVFSNTLIEDLTNSGRIKYNKLCEIPTAH